MPEFCRTPAESDSPLASAFGAVPELIVQGDYCRQKGGCAIFLKAGQPGATDFFDRVTGFHGCRHLASYLKANNPFIDEAAIGGWCEGRKVRAADRSLIPDIISHQPGRFEFYEIKPASQNGLAAGQRKITNFLELCAGHGLPYAAGKLYQPRLKILVFDGTWLTVPAKAYLRIDFEEPALISYKICIESQSEWVTETMAKLLIKMLAAALILLATKAPALAVGAAAAAVLLVSLTRSPLLATVGGDGEQDEDATRYVQWLLNDWRDRTGLATVREDGVLDGDTADAISQFQQQMLGAASGTIEPGDATIRALEQLHVENMLSQVTVEPDLLPSDDSVFDERAAALAAAESDADDVDLKTLLGSAVQDYLDGLYLGWQP